MKQTASARFAIKSWDEKPFNEGDDLPKMTRATVSKTYTGHIAGEGQVEYLMMYRKDGSAHFVGLERIVGQIGGRVGSFRRPRLCDRRAPSPRGRRQLRRRSWHGDYELA